jgi:hypothetical protein
MTALFTHPPGRRLALDAEILDHRIRQQLAAHRLDLRLADAGIEVELDQLAGAHLVDAGKAEALQRMVDRLSLRVENPLLQGDVDSGLHGRSPGGGDCPPYGQRPLPRQAFTGR